MTRKGEIEAVKLVGEKIGYGNLMSIATALWRRDLRSSGVPVEGAFVATCLPYISDKDGYRDGLEEEIKHYDHEIAKELGDYD